MYISINGNGVVDINAVYESCKRLGYKTDWYGKTNSFVELRGVEPSYGYFLVDYVTATTLVDLSGGPDQVVSGEPGARRAKLRIISDQLTDPSKPYNSSTNKYVEKTIEDLYVESVESIIPNRNPQESFYLVKLVDARFILSFETPNRYRVQWAPDAINLVAGYLTASQLKSKYDLKDTPENGEFIYYQSTTKVPDNLRKLGETEDGEQVYAQTEPYTWQEAIETVIMCGGRTGSVEENHDPIFPYFELKGDGISPQGFSKPAWQFELKVPANFEFPEYVPQNIDLRNHSPQEWLYILLYWIGADIVYRGKGKFELIELSIASAQYGSPSINATNFQKLIYDTANATNLSYNEIFVTGDDEDRNGNDQLQFVFPYMKGEATGHFDYDYYYEEDFTPFEFPENSSYDPTGFPDSYKPGLSKRVRKVWFPCVYSSNLDYSDSENQYQNVMEKTASLFWKRRLQYPCQSYSFAGFVFVPLSGIVERVCYYDTSASSQVHMTRVDNILPVRYDLLGVKVLVDQKDSLTIAKGKVLSTVSGGDSVPFTITDLIIGSFIGDDDQEADNTYKNSYEENEEIIVLKSSSSGSLTTFEENSSPLDWVVLIPKEYNVLRVPKEYATDSGSGTYDVDLAVVEIVSGKKPFPNETSTSLTVKDSPNTKLEEDDTYLYFRYDITAGDDIFSQWSTADAANFKPILQGFPNWKGGDPEVFAHYSGDDSSSSIQWGELAKLLTYLGGYVPSNLGLVIGHDGNKAVWREDAVGGGGGGGGGGDPGTGFTGGTNTISAAIATVTQNTSSGQNIPFTNPVMICGTQPTNNLSAVNTLRRPYMNGETLLVLSGDGSTWYGIKSGHNIASFIVDTDEVWGSDVSVTPTTSFSAISGTSLTISGDPGAVTVYNSIGASLIKGDVIAACLSSAGTWRLIGAVPEQGRIFQTRSTISAANVNDVNKISVGGGNGRKMQLKTNGFWEPIGNNIPIYNIVPLSIAINRIVMCKRIGPRWFVDVEACG